MKIKRLCCIGVLVAAALNLSCGRRVMAPPTAKRPAEPAPRFVEGKEPRIRIGLLTEVSEVIISSPAKFYFRDGTAESDDPLKGEVIVSTGHALRGQRRIYRVQVASLVSLANAERLRRRLEEEFDQQASIRYNPLTQTHQVQVGRFASWNEADNLARQLEKRGYDRPWIVQDSELISDGAAPGQIVLRADGGSLHRASSRFIFQPGSDSDPLLVNGTPYRGALDVFVGPSGRITLVNEVGLEDYLRSVVSSEMSPQHFPALEALKAQAIAARTYAISNLGQYRDQGFDLQAGDRSQVYRGAKMEKPLSDRAVRETEGLVMVYDRQPIQALYTASCGGRTEDYDKIFGGDFVPYLKSVDCPPERRFGGRRSAEWKVVLSRAELTRRASKYSDIGQVQDLKPTELSPSERVIELKIVGTKGELTLRGLRIRQMLGLSSNIFAIKRMGSRQQQSFAFIGRGRGHGVGLCQTGAYGLARSGYSFIQILKRYYRGVQIKKLY